MVWTFQRFPQSWWVRTKYISGLADAESKAQKFEDKHPGLRWTGNWKAATPGKVSAIEVASVGPVVVSLGPTSSNNDANGKIDDYLRKHPYLKLIGNCSHTGWLQKFQMAVEATLPSAWHAHGGTDAACLSVATKLRVANRTTDTVIRISVRDTDDNDWGARQPSDQLSGCQIDEQSFVETELDMNFWSHSARLTAWLTFQSGRYLRFRVNNRVAMDSAENSHWKHFCGQGLTVYHLVEPGSRLLEVVVCES